MADERGPDKDSPDFQAAFTREARLREEGVHPRLRLSQVHLRLGSRFISVWWLLLGVVLLGVVAVVALKLFVRTSAAQSFIDSNPCVPTLPIFEPGIPVWVIITHWMNFFLMLTIVRSGWQILADHPRLYAKIH
jgi:methionine sulfoxide reductase catalytic subunit